MEGILDLILSIYSLVLGCVLGIIGYFFVTVVYHVVYWVVETLGKVLIKLHRAVWTGLKLPEHTRPNVESFDGLPAIIAIACLWFFIGAITGEAVVSFVIALMSFVAYFYRKLIWYLLQQLGQKAKKP